MPLHQPCIPSISSVVVQSLFTKQRDDLVISKSIPKASQAKEKSPQKIYFRMKANQTTQVLNAPVIRQLHGKFQSKHRPLYSQQDV